MHTYYDIVLLCTYVCTYVYNILDNVYLECEYAVSLNPAMYTQYCKCVRTVLLASSTRP